MVLTCQIPFMIQLANSNPEWLKYEWIWEKTAPTGFLNANRMPMKAHENILVFYETLGTYNPQGLHYSEKHACGSHCTCYDADSNYAGKGDFFGAVDFPRDILRFAKDKISHPTAKPVALFEYLIRTYTNEGEIVLDNCIGSGTTAVACIRSKRHFIGFETDENYCRLAEERIRNTQVNVNKKSLEEWF